MLYFLKNVTNDSIFYLIKKERFVVGRKNCDFIIQNDQSISREHAAIYLKNGQVTVEDLGSRYKTVYNGQELTPKSEVPLEVNTEIKFGRFNSLYRLERMDIITTGTHINATDKAKLKNILSVVGGTYVDNWTSDCTHLTVKAMSVTMKVLHALVDKKPIIVSDYWNNFCQSALSNKLPPDINDFNKPPVAEPLLQNIDFTNEVCRKFLFQNKTFIFPTEKSKKMMEAIILKTGGKCISWEANSFPVSKLLLSLNNYLIIQDSNNESSVFKDLVSAVVKRGKRPIPIQEIALAIIKGSCEKDCNPDFDRAGAVFTKTLPILPTQTGVLAHNTESEVFAIGDIKDVDTTKVVPDTFDPPLEPSLSVKKEKQLPQKPSSSSTEAVLEDTSRSTKRKNDEAENEVMEKKMRINSSKMCAPSTSIAQQQEKPNSPEKVFRKTVQRPEKTEFPEEGNSRRPSKFTTENQSTNVEKGQSLPKKNNPFNKFIKREKESPVQEVTESPTKHFKSENIQKGQPEESVFKVPVPRNITNVSLPSSSYFEKTDNIFSSTRQNISTTSEEMTRRPSKNESENNPWFSKPTLSKDISTENIDPELMKISELFKERVVIQFIELDSFIRPKYSNKCVEIVDGNTVKNFKKFVKVTPIRKHTNPFGDFETFSMIIPAGTFHNNASCAFYDSDDES